MSQLLSIPRSDRNLRGELQRKRDRETEIDERRMFSWARDRRLEWNQRSSHGMNSFSSRYSWIKDENQMEDQDAKQSLSWDAYRSLSLSACHFYTWTPRVISPIRYDFIILSIQSMPSNPFLTMASLSTLLFYFVLLTEPLTFSPSKKTGHFSLLSLSSLISTCFLSSWPSNLMSTSTGEAKEKNDAINAAVDRGGEDLVLSLSSLSTHTSILYWLGWVFPRRSLHLESVCCAHQEQQVYSILHPRVEQSLVLQLLLVLLLLETTASDFSLQTHLHLFSQIHKRWLQMPKEQILLLQRRPWS